MTDVSDIYIRLIRDGEGEEIAEEILRKLSATEGWFTDSGVKPRCSGRGYKPRKPGADFI